MGPPLFVGAGLEHSFHGETANFLVAVGEDFLEVGFHQEFLDQWAAVDGVFDVVFNQGATVAFVEGMAVAPEAVGTAELFIDEQGWGLPEGYLAAPADRDAVEFQFVVDGCSLAHVEGWGSHHAEVKEGRSYAFQVKGVGEKGKDLVRGDGEPLFVFEKPGLQGRGSKLRVAGQVDGGVEEANGALGGAFQQISGTGEAAFEAHGTVGDTDQASDAVVVEFSGTGTDTAGEDDGGDSLSPSAAGDTHRGFVVDGGLVGAAFAGDDQVSALEMAVEFEDLADHIDTGAEVGAGEGDEASAEAAGGSGALAVEDVDAQVLFNDAGEVGEGCIEFGDDAGGGAFLGAEDGGCAGGAAEGVGDVGGADDGGRSQVGVDGGAVDGREAGEGRAAGGEGLAGLVEETDTEGGGHAGAGVVGGAAAEADNDAGVAEVEGFLDDFAGAAGGGGAGIAAFGRDEGEAGGAGHFDHGGYAVAHDAPEGFDGLTQGAGNDAAAHFAAGGVDQGFQGAVAAVGHWNEDGFSVGGSAEDAALDGLGGLQGVEAAFETLGGDYDFHGSRR